MHVIHESINFVMIQSPEKFATCSVSKSGKTNLKEGRSKRAILDDNGSPLGFIIKWNDGSSDLIRVKDLGDVSVFFGVRQTVLQTAADSA